MKKVLSLVFVIMVVSIAACQQAVNKDAAQSQGDSASPLDNIPSPVIGSNQKTGSTGNSDIDSIGSNIDNSNKDEKDLGTDDFSDLDSGLMDVENI